MKKTITLSLVLVSSLLLTACGNDNPNPSNNTGSTTEKTDTVTNTGTATPSTSTGETTPGGADTGTGNIAGTGAVANVLIIDDNSPLEEAFKNDPNLNTTFLPQGDNIREAFVGKMKQASGEMLVVEPSAEGLKQGAKTLNIPVNEYYPLMIFKASEKDITTIDLDTILKENPNFVYTYEQNGETYFAFKSPLFVGGIKRVQTLTDDMLTSLQQNSFLITGEKDDSKKSILMVEDPLCPYCAQDFLSANMQQNVLKNFNAYILPVALPMHAKAPELAGLWIVNKTHPKISELIKKTFENQTQLSNVDFNNREAVMTTFGITDEDGFNVPNQTDLVSAYNNDSVQKMSANLGIQGTPTLFKMEGNVLTLVTNPTELGLQ